MLSKTKASNGNPLEAFYYNFVYKPGSVLNGHLSLLSVTTQLRGSLLAPPADICRAGNPTTVLLPIEFTANLCYHRSG